MLLLSSIRLHVPVSVRECMIDYLIETTCIYIYLCFIMLHFMCLFISMSNSVRQHKLWCTVRDMHLSKCSIIIINMLYWCCSVLSVAGRSSQSSCLLFLQT